MEDTKNRLDQTNPYDRIVGQLIADLEAQNEVMRREDRKMRRLGRDPRDHISEADIVASRYMQRRLKDDILCMQRLAREGTVFYSSGDPAYCPAAA